MAKIATIFAILVAQADSKYLQGIIHTSDNWAFLARFCFLSEQGEFEYNLEFSEDQGTPNLLLYYDTDDQWSAVYKSHKTCLEKESVLHAEQNQIINLTARHAYYKDLSGCSYLSPVLPSTSTTPTPKYTMRLPTLPQRNYTRNRKVTPVPKVVTKPSTTSTAAPATITDFITITTAGTTTEAWTEDTTQFEITSSDTETTTIQNDPEHLEIVDDVEEFIPGQLFPSFSGITVKKAPLKKRSVPQLPLRTFGSRIISCHNARRFRSARERWWFIVISNCNGTKGIHVKYKILMTNGPYGDYWHEQFSADEFYILPVLMAFSIAYAFLMLGVIVCSIELKSRQLLHTTYKVFVVSTILQLFGIIVSSAAYLKYAVNGTDTHKVRRFGSILMGASETLFLMQLLLLAKGYTITRGRLSLGATVKLTIFMCLYVVTYISIFIYEANVFDPGEVLYLYESPAGYGLMILRILAWCMFVYSTVFTLKHYPEKSHFYYPFNVCGTLWFIAGPAFILSANTYIDKWVRESVVCAVLQFITFGGHLSFLILTMPSLANKNFPYHVRTTQIGIMELTGNTGASTIEQFSHHVYEPTNGVVRDQTLIVPLTRRTEEIFEGMYSQTGRGPGIHSSRNYTESHLIDQNGADPTMENVVNWSMAKNVAAIELPNFERIKRGSFGSTLSRNSGTNSLPDSRRPSTNHETCNGHFQDYLTDVPIELFTISRMMVTNKSSQNGNSSNIESLDNPKDKL